jgi:catechol 2,3-dioxygenase-like lactoylglutathione lyase family enzyme
MRRLLTATLTCLLLATSAAAPVSDDERVPIDLRRTTLVVQDIDASLAFYRDALGMEVIYDRSIRTPRDAPSDAAAELARRLVFLRANDTYIGVLGLLQYTNPVKPAPHQGDTPFSTGSMVLLFNAEDVKSTFALARAVTGVRVISEPTLTEYPAYDGAGTIKVIVSALTDPDGFVIELNQLLTDPLE